MQKVSRLFTSFIFSLKVIWRSASAGQTTNLLHEHPGIGTGNEEVYNSSTVIHSQVTALLGSSYPSKNTYRECWIHQVMELGESRRWYILSIKCYKNNFSSNIKFKHCVHDLLFPPFESWKSASKRVDGFER